jgi:hypothetical protein
LYEDDYILKARTDPSVLENLLERFFCIVKFVSLVKVRV